MKSKRTLEAPLTDPSVYFGPINSEKAKTSLRVGLSLKMDCENLSNRNVFHALTNFAEMWWRSIIGP